MPKKIAESEDGSVGGGKRGNTEPSEHW